MNRGVDATNALGVSYDESHGTPFDRGGADYYYRRPACPHYWPQGTGRGIKVSQGDMSQAEIAAYHAGFVQAAAQGDQKDY